MDMSESSSIPLLVSRFISGGGGILKTPSENWFTCIPPTGLLPLLRRVGGDLLSGGKSIGGGKLGGFSVKEGPGKSAVRGDQE